MLHGSLIKKVTIWLQIEITRVKSLINPLFRVFEVHTNLVEDILLLRLRADCSLEAPLFIPHSWLILQPLEELLRFCNQRNIRNASNDLLHRSSSHGFFLSLSFLHRPAYSDTLGSSIILLWFFQSHNIFIEPLFQPF